MGTYEGHSTNIADYPCLKRIGELAPHKAFKLLRDSRYIRAIEGRYPGDQQFKTRGMVNSAWAVVDLSPAHNTVEVVYHRDGMFWLYRASLAQFLRATREQTAWNPVFFRIREEIGLLADAVPG